MRRYSQTVNKVVGIVKNIGLIIITELAAGILSDVVVTFGVNENVSGLFQLMSGTLAVAWITFFVLANIKNEH